jgi:hypothetical protein
MDWVCEICGTGGADRAEDARAWIDAAVPTWKVLAAVAAIDLYRPIERGAHDPFNNDGPGPLFLAMLAFPTRDALSKAMAQEAFGGRPIGLTFTATCFERRFYPAAGETKASLLTAPFSYVVRYHRPADDEAAFIKNYVDAHPPTLAKLPGIRSVMCYFPQDIVASALPAADYMIGNEVVFDSVARNCAGISVNFRHSPAATHTFR